MRKLKRCDGTRKPPFVGLIDVVWVHSFLGADTTGWHAVYVAYSASGPPQPGPVETCQKLNAKRIEQRNPFEGLQFDMFKDSATRRIRDSPNTEPSEWRHFVTIDATLQPCLAEHRGPL